MPDGRPVMRGGFRIGMCILAAWLGVFSGFRLALFLRYRDAFASLGGTDAAFAFLDGVRFDLSIAILVVGLPVFMLLLPVSRRWWIVGWMVPAVALGILAPLVLCGDFVYFGETGRHIGEEFRTCWGDMDFVVATCLHYGPGMAGFAIALVAVPWWLARLIRRRFEWVAVPAWRVALTAVVALALMLQAYRGVIKGKPLGLIDAYSRGSSAYGNLVLNGLFSAVHASRRAGPAQRGTAGDAAIATAAAAVLCPWEEAPAPEYPLQRRLRAGERTGQSNRWNVVLVLMESFGSEFVEACAHKGYGVSPCLDDLATNGLFYTRFYANGQRSVHGWASIFLSTPPVSGLPYLGAGLEVSGVHRIGMSLARNGYRTIGVNTGPRRSYRADAIASALGFEEYAGKADMPKRQKVEAGRPLPPFGWDYDGFMYLLDVVDAKPGPFFAFMIAGTPHEPYCLPDGSFEKYPHATHGLNGLLNTLRYSDWALGAFMNEARKRPWFDKTVFVITSDHAAGVAGRTDPEARFGIPLILLAPGVRGGVVDRVASQADIWPTIVDLLGLPDEYSGIGRSLTRNAPRPFALLDEGSSMAIVTEGGWMRHSRVRRLETVLLPGAGPDEADRMESLLVAIDQTLYTLFKRNRFFRE